MHAIYIKSMCTYLDITVLNIKLKCQCHPNYRKVYISSFSLSSISLCFLFVPFKFLSLLECLHISFLPMLPHTVMSLGQDQINSIASLHDKCMFWGLEYPH